MYFLNQLNILMIFEIQHLILNTFLKD